MVDVVNVSTADVTPANNASVAGISILGTGLVSTADDSFRTIVSFLAKWWDDFGAVNTIGGTANAITITTPTLYTAFKQGIVVAFKNTGGPNTTAVTLNLDALGAKAIRLQGDSALVGGEMVANGVYLLRYDTSYNAAAGAWVLMNVAGTTLATNAQAATATSTTVALTPANLAQERGFSDAPFINLSLGTPTVAASALTITFKGVDGNDWSASNPGYVSFRSATAGSGATAQLALTAAMSLVVSSGSTLGMTSAVAATLALAIFNDAGTARPAVMNVTTGIALPLADGIASATSEGGAGAADSAGVWYSNAAITSKAYTIVGYLVATEATAGTWATAPATTQVGPVYAANNAVPIITPWVAYTPTFTGFGTATTISFFSRRYGSNLEVIGSFTNGTTSGTVGQITIGFNGTSANVTINPTVIPGIRSLGLFVVANAAAPNYVLANASNTFVQFGGNGGASGLTALAVNGFLGTGIVASLSFSIPITGW